MTLNLKDYLVSKKSLKMLDLYRFSFRMAIMITERHLIKCILLELVYQWSMKMGKEKYLYITEAAKKYFL